MQIDPLIIKNKDRSGEAKFLRALAYFDLVRIFCDVQMITGVPTRFELAFEGHRQFDLVSTGNLWKLVYCWNERLYDCVPGSVKPGTSNE
jgi:hypothetical protein